MTTYRVTIARDGLPAGTVKVTDAATREEAEARAIEVLFEADARRAARVAASGGPAWAAKATPLSAFSVLSVRRYSR